MSSENRSSKKRSRAQMVKQSGDIVQNSHDYKFHDDGSFSVVDNASAGNDGLGTTSASDIPPVASTGKRTQLLVTARTMVVGGRARGGRPVKLRRLTPLEGGNLVDTGFERGARRQEQGGCGRHQHHCTSFPPFVSTLTGGLGEEDQQYQQDHQLAESASQSGASMTPGVGTAANIRRWWTSTATTPSWSRLLRSAYDDSVFQPPSAVAPAPRPVTNDMVITAGIADEISSPFPLQHEKQRQSLRTMAPEAQQHQRHHGGVNSSHDKKEAEGVVEEATRSVLSLPLGPTVPQDSFWRPATICSSGLSSPLQRRQGQGKPKDQQSSTEREEKMLLMTNLHSIRPSVLIGESSSASTAEAKRSLDYVHRSSFSSSWQAQQHSSSAAQRRQLSSFGHFRARKTEHQPHDHHEISGDTRTKDEGEERKIQRLVEAATGSDASSSLGLTAARRKRDHDTVAGEGSTTRKKQDESGNRQQQNPKFNAAKQQRQLEKAIGRGQRHKDKFDDENDDMMGNVLSFPSGVGNIAEYDTSTTISSPTSSQHQSPAVLTPAESIRRRLERYDLTFGDMQQRGRESSVGISQPRGIVAPPGTTIPIPKTITDFSSEYLSILRPHSGAGGTAAPGSDVSSLWSSARHLNPIPAPAQEVHQRQEIGALLLATKSSERPSSRCHEESAPRAIQNAKAKRLSTAEVEQSSRQKRAIIWENDGKRDSRKGKEEVRKNEASTIHDEGAPVSERELRGSVGVGMKYQQNEKWMTRYNALLEFRTENGHCNVPFGYNDRPYLAQWVKRQRYQYKCKFKGTASHLTEERQELLENIGFQWDYHDAAWEEKFALLDTFRRESGHCSVPTNEKQLFAWCKRQRRQYRSWLAGRLSTPLTEARIARLTSLGFPWNAAKASVSSSASRNTSLSSSSSQVPQFPDADIDDGTRRESERCRCAASKYGE